MLYYGGLNILTHLFIKGKLSAFQRLHYFEEHSTMRQPMLWLHPEK